MNFETAIKTINKDFSNLFYTKYLKGSWGIVVGYRTIPDHIARMRKQIADWQLLNDCNNTLCTESKGHISNTCCRTTNAIPVLFTDRADCCLPGYVLNATDGRCYLPGSSIPFPPSPCGFCPTGYLFDGSGSIAGCVGPSGDVINVTATSGLHCTLFSIDSSGITRGNPNVGLPTFPCTDLVQDFIIIKTAQLSSPGTCVLNPPLSPFGHHCRRWNLNVNEILISSFTR